MARSRRDHRVRREGSLRDRRRILRFRPGADHRGNRSHRRGVGPASKGLFRHPHRSPRSGRTHGLDSGSRISFSVGARPGEGKTSLALNIALAAGRARKVVLIFSLEMPLRQIAIRLLFSQARVDARQLSRPGMLSDRDRKLLRKRLARSRRHAPSCGRLECHAGELRSKARQLRREHGLDLIVVDSPAHAGGGTGNPALREPESGDRGDQPVSQGAGEGTRCAGAGALPAQPGAREA